MNANLWKRLRRPLLAGYVGATLPYRAWANRRRAAAGRSPIVVLFYHRIADDRGSPWTHSTCLFERQIRWLQKHCELISLEEAQRRIRRGSNERLAACITFDDGYAENCDHALPLLVREKIPCTYFVSHEQVATGKRFPHDVAENLPGQPNSVAQLRWMASEGIEIGSHSRTHADLGRITDDCKLYDEVVAAGEDLQSLVGRPIHYFSFPFGLPQHLSARAFQMACEYGYEGVCSAYGDYNLPGDDAFHLRRIHADDMAQLRNWCTVDPRHLKPAHTFSYSLHGEAFDSTPVCPQI